MKTLKQALKSEIEKNDKISNELSNLSIEFDKLKEEIKSKDLQIVKNFNDYIQTYEELLKLRNDKGIIIGKTQKPSKKDKKKNNDKDIFDKSYWKSKLNNRTIKIHNMKDYKNQFINKANISKFLMYKN